MRIVGESSGRRLTMWSIALAAFLVVAGIATASADAASPVYSFETVPNSTQAGGHPDIHTGFEVGNRATQGFPSPCFCEDPKIITSSLPAGVIGNPHVTPQCTTSQFAEQACPIDSQVGVGAILLYNKIGLEGAYFYMPIFNMVPHPNQAGLLQFPAPIVETPISVELNARTGSDYGLDAVTAGLERLAPIRGAHTFLWGVPADPVHDILRFPKLSEIQYDLVFCEVDVLPALAENKVPDCGTTIEPNSSNSPREPFLSNPTTCAGTLTSTIETYSYDNEYAYGSTTYPAITGCDQLSFNPSLSAKPTTTQADAASGVDIELSVPQFQSPTTPSPSQIRSTTVTLPEGFSINPSAADGKVSCSDSDARFGTRNAAECPEFSKVGSLILESSALPGPIPGFIYLGDPKPGDRYRIILTADGFATHVKLPGSIKADPRTGQLVATFTDLPQSPLTNFKFHFFGSERGLLATPTQCGTYPVRSTFTPWDAALAEQTSVQFFSLDSGPGGAPCPGASRPFKPGFHAASTGNRAGSHSPFWLQLNRSDGEQNVAGLEVTTPPGFAATLKGIPYCPTSALERLGGGSVSGLAELAGSTCPASSQVGVATVGSGAGTHPLYSPGKVYLAGPYQGSPLSLEVVVPAVSGPYDLGSIGVRVPIDVDPTTAQVTAKSAPLPQILGGIPLRLRSIEVNLDRPGFALNPTNCDRFATRGVALSTGGAKAALSTPYQVADCADLGFEPELSLQIKGSTVRGGHPALTAALKTDGDDANIKRTSVKLPRVFFLDSAHIRNPCTRVQYARNACPPASRLGTARAYSPLLDKPLEGPVYLRTSSHKLPDLVAALRGQFDIDLAGRIDTIKGRLRTSFESVPDVPVSAFSLKLVGGSKGLLLNSQNVCAKTRKFSLRMDGQNGLQVDSDQPIKTPCGKQAGKKKRSQR